MVYCCIERELCFPNPCQHNGTCFITEDNTYVCNCDGTGYSGEKCDVLLINTPDISALIINSPKNFSLFSRPDRNFVLELVPDDRSNLKVKPSSLIFSEMITEHNISVIATEPGVYKLQYKVKDDSLNYQPIPPATILVSDNDTDFSSCEERNVTCGLMQPGCCRANEVQLDLKFQCPPSDSELFLKSTCGWVDKKSPVPLHSAGVIFSSINGFELPVAVGGAQFLPDTTHIDLQSLTAFEFRHGCVRCTKYPNCEIERLSVESVQESLRYDSLAFTYLHQSAQLVPSWLTLRVLPSDRDRDHRSYFVYLVYSANLNRVQECNEPNALTDGLYSILVYYGTLEVTLDEEIRQHKSSRSAVCIATNLCEGSNSPLYISISDEAQTAINSFEFMHDLKSKGWSVTINNVIMSDTNVIPIFEELTRISYWNGREHFSSNLQNLNMITEVKFTKSFFKDTGIEASWNFSGNVYLFHKEFNEVCTLISNIVTYLLFSHYIYIYIYIYIYH